MKSFKEKIGNELEITPALPHIEIFSNREVNIEGCKGVLQYDDGIIRMNTGKQILRITGTDLSMTSLGLEQAVIRGRILSIDFV